MSSACKLKFNRPERLPEAGNYGSLKVWLVRSHQKRPQFWAMIDPDDCERVRRLRWAPKQLASGVYAFATSLYGIPKHHRALHRFIVKAEPGQIVDHINGDTLDNRKANLRIVTAAQSSQNRLRTMSGQKTSRFKGVSWSAGLKRWVANITANGSAHYIGAFDDECEAALAYDAAARLLHGEFARTNEQMGLFARAPESRLDMVEHSTYAPRLRRDEHGLGPLRPAD